MVNTLSAVKPSVPPKILEESASESDSSVEVEPMAQDNISQLVTAMQRINTRPYGLQNIQVDFFRGGPKQNFTKWLKYFNRYAKASGWDDEMKVKTLPCFLVGPAESAYDELSAAENSDFNTLVEKLKEKLPAPNLDDLAAALLFDRKQGLKESVTDYANEIQRLVHEAYANTLDKDSRGKLELQHFRSGLKPSLRRMMAVAPPKSFADALSMACRLESQDHLENGDAPWLDQSLQQNTRSKNGKRNGPGVCTVETLQKNDVSTGLVRPEGLVKIEKHFTSAITSNVMSQLEPLLQTIKQQIVAAPFRQTSTDFRPRNESEQRLAYRTSNQPSDRTSRHCTYCGKTGHTREFCWLLNRSSRQPPNLQKDSRTAGQSSRGVEERLSRDQGNNLEVHLLTETDSCASESKHTPTHNKSAVASNQQKSGGTEGEVISGPQQSDLLRQISALEQQNAALAATQNPDFIGCLDVLDTDTSCASRTAIDVPTYRAVDASTTKDIVTQVTSANCFSIDSPTLQVPAVLRDLGNAASRQHSSKQRLTEKQEQ